MVSELFYQTLSDCFYAFHFLAKYVRVDISEDEFQKKKSCLSLISFHIHFFNESLGKPEFCCKLRVIKKWSGDNELDKINQLV